MINPRTLRPNAQCRLRSLCTMLGVCLMSINVIQAQQEQAYSLQMWNLLAVNPAYAGTSGQMSASLSGRYQWVRLEGAPSSQLLSAHAPLRSVPLAFGADVARDNTGPVDQFHAFADIAYHLRAGKEVRLSLGMKAGAEWMQMRLSQVPGVDPGDPIFQQDRSSAARPNIGAGAHLWNQHWYVGISVPKLLEYDALELEAAGVRMTGARQMRHYHFLAGGDVRLTGDLDLHGWMMMRATRSVPLSVDVALGLAVKERVWIGVGMRNVNALSAILAYRFQDRLRLGYAYEYAMGALRSVQGGTHEINITYDVKFRHEKTLSPRFF